MLKIISIVHIIALFTAAPSFGTSRAILLVVDMQEGFEARRYGITGRIEEEIASAVESNDTIIFLEYEDRGNTIHDLSQPLCDYERCFHLIKSKDGGGDIVIETLKELGPEKYKIRICGIKTGHCVRGTILELCQSEIVSEVIAIENACAHTQCYHPHHSYYNRKELESTAKELASRKDSKFKIEYTEDDDY